MATSNSSLVNHTLPNLVGGVSQQFTEARFETQVEDMINCIPSVSRGVLRRNPLRYSSELSGFLSNYSNNEYFTYTYDRGTVGEQYLLVLHNTESGKNYKVFNIITGTLISDGYDSYYEVSDGTPLKEAYDAITIGDFTFIINKTKVVTTTSAPDYSDKILAHKRLVHWIKKTTAVPVSQYTSSTSSSQNTGSLIEGYSYTLNGATVKGIKDTRPNQTQVDKLDASSIAAGLASSLGYSSQDSFVYTNSAVDTNITSSDSFGNEASQLLHLNLDSASKLPAIMPLGFDKIIRITGAGSVGEDDDYWLEYSTASSVWREVMSPYITTIIDIDTMPRVIVRVALDTFVSSKYDETSLIAAGVSSEVADGLGWKQRIVGDENTCPDPSFVGKKISSIIFHKNRLGFIVNDSIILSELGGYGNFYPTTMQSVPDDDPIDLMVATTDVTVLRNAVSTSSALLLFSDDAQFTLSSLEGPLTPTTANIETASHYTYSDKAKPKALGNKVFFTSQSGGYAQLFSYNLAQGLQNTEAQEITAHVPSYLPSDIRTIVGHSVLGYVFLLASSSPDVIYVLNSVSKEGRDVQQAIHKWKFNREIEDIYVLNNVLYILAKGETELATTNLCYISLEIPGDITNVNYMDEYEVSTTTAYESNVKLSRFHIRDENGFGTNRGRTQIRTIQYSLKPESYYMTSIYNTDIVKADGGLFVTSFWDDSILWDDTKVWKDRIQYYNRDFYNDSKVSVLSNAAHTQIEIKNNIKEPSKGFEIATVNIEAFHFQRSLRR
jgi:hypothetical protein